jgi:4,5-dihydroxyphthalate decarboxylase
MKNRNRIPATRRGFLQRAALGGASIGTLSQVAAAQQTSSAAAPVVTASRRDNMVNGKLRLTMACWNYDRTRALMEGRIPIDGVELTYMSLPVEETFFRMLRYGEFDVAEMSLSSYTLSLFRDPAPFIAIPVFPSRMFRHSCIYVSAKSNIREPKDLIGKRIGNPEYQMTAPVWIRGILADEYGVPVTSTTYFSGGEEEPGRTEKIPLSLPPTIRTGEIPNNKTLSQMIESGEIDALYTARAPSTYRNEAGNVKRLFPNYAAIEREYYRKTKIFPIMHTVVIRRELYQQYPWVAQALYKAFVLSQREVYQELHETAALKTMLPWVLEHVEETEKLMGPDFWAYGYQPNLHTLTTFLRYSYEQGLSKRLLSPKDLFAPETLESFKI